MQARVSEDLSYALLVAAARVVLFVAVGLELLAGS